ncbi:MAG: DUF5615 family PIN-like protein, partial [Chloroflexi bacterium]|nr:DUF5615 family PIN-like protein [Chloroflexota bacterium]
MRFLADESSDIRVAQALRRAGHDVVAVAETARGAPDREVLETALKDRRILLTEDRDFGRLGPKLEQSFVVWTPRRVRVRRLE